VKTGVPAAAASATLGLELLVTVLGTVARRKKAAGEPARIESLGAAARLEIRKLAELAEQDAEVYGQYLKTRQPSPGLIGVPMEAARSALSGLNLCAEASGMVRGEVSADLGAAAILLEGALRAMLLCVEVNLHRLPDSESAAERKMLEATARRQLDSVLATA
jgi:formiminotetrahydrofolate cyclodeaminase